MFDPTEEIILRDVLLTREQEVELCKGFGLPTEGPQFEALYERTKQDITTFVHKHNENVGFYRRLVGKEVW